MPRLGEAVKLALQLFNGATDKYVRATLQNADESVTYPTVDMPHVTGGKYVANGFVMPNQPVITAQYRVYDDAGYTTLSTEHSIEAETFELDTSETDAAAAARQVTNIAEHDATQAAIASLELGGGSGAGASSQELVGLVEGAQLVGILEEET